MKFKNALFAVGTAAMLVAPVAAQAGTVASASTGKIANLSGVGERRSAPVKAKNKAEAGVLALAVLGAGAATYGVVRAVDDDKSNGS